MLDGIEEAGERRFRRALDVGYIGQSYQVTVLLEGRPDGDNVRDFRAALSREIRLFLRRRPGGIVNLRVLGEIAGAGLDLRRPKGRAAAAPSGERQAYSPSRGEMIPFAVYDHGPAPRYDVPGTLRH